MCNPLPIGGKRLALQVAAKNKIIHGAIVLVLIGISVRVCFTQPTYYARAYSGSGAIQAGIKSPMFGNDKDGLFGKGEKQIALIQAAKAAVKKDDSASADAIKASGDADNILSEKIYKIVGNAPIKEMVPFISKNDAKVAAFLVGIAQKESSLGAASPSKGGKDCYNYWGYKGEGGRGDVLGYSCFSSAQEAVETVGRRIQTLVDKQRDTPSRMVDTWKCGGSCAGDPGAPGWISTVALDFNKIV